MNVWIDLECPQWGLVLRIDALGINVRSQYRTQNSATQISKVSRDDGWALN